ncbi:MAG TPA: hypothetical protein VI111_01755 [Thermoleophilaceae bacterium]
MKLLNSSCVAGALVAVALAVPGSAAAVPGVYSVVAKTGNDGVTFLNDPTGAALTNTETQYTVTADGYVLGFSEDNGVTGGGVLDYKQLPADYRAPMSAEEKRTYGPAQTDVQAHATCSGVTELSSGPTILSWQDDDPSYDYVPWQKATAGLGDDPGTWVPVVKAATGVDLAALSTVQDFTDACTGLGGTYHPADTSTAVASALITAAVAPFKKQVTELQDKVKSLTKDKAAAEKSLATEKDTRKAAETAYQEQYNRPLKLTLAGRRFAATGGVALLVTGSISDPVTVTLELTKKRASALGLRSRVLVEATIVINTEGAAITTLKPTKAVAKAIAKHKGAVPAKVVAESSALSAKADTKLTR